jgi:uncharacterized protein (DUF3820 family)
MLMPFGKFRGADLAEVPDAYLEWLCTIELRQPLLGAVLNEVQERGLTTDQRPTASGLDPDKVKATYRELSLQFHPDRPGGTKEAMQAINLFYERLKDRAN